MADLTPNFVYKISDLVAASGKKIRISVRNADGSTASVLKEHTIPAGKSFSGYFVYRGQLEGV